MEQLGQINWKYSDPARRICSNVVLLVSAGALRAEARPH